MASPLNAILKALKKLKLDPQDVDRAMERTELLSTQTPLDRYSPSLVARSTSLSPAAQRGFSEGLVPTREPFAATLMRPSEFLERTPPLDTLRDQRILEGLRPSIQKDKLRDAPVLWIDEYPGSLEAGYEGRHRMKTLQDLYGDDPVLMNLIQGNRYDIRPSPWTPGEMERHYIDRVDRSPLDLLKQEIQFGDRPVELSPLWTKDYAEGGPVRIPTQDARFMSPEEEDRGRAAFEALRGYAGAPSRASVMHPGSQEAYESGELAGMAEMLIPGAAMAKGALGAALAGVIKPRGGNWIPGDVESSISNLFERLGETDPQRLAALREQMGNPELGRSGEALGRWIEGPLTKYIKRDMATPEDPVRRLADEGILHMGIPQTIGAPSRGIQVSRRLEGFPEEGLSETPGGSLWENLSDRVISKSPAHYLRDDPKLLLNNPWLARLDPESPVYGMPAYIERGLGFDHLVDELSNALNPESGLPRNLLLRPEQMQQMSMEKAVRHVDAINKWRTAQREAANAELANKALTIRQYPDTPEMPNPKGLRWTELGKDTPDLEKQLKYEGDTMGHCVGGYCPDVLEGKSRIFSLRDAKGEPHVTIEVEPSRKPQFDAHGDFEKLPTELQDQIIADYGAGAVGWARRVQEDPRVISWVEANVPTPPPVIKQIKGKQNQAPKDEYLPFVQDFVRNSPLGTQWGGVGDLRNTGLRKVGDRYVLPHELKDVPKTPDGLPRGYEPLDDLPEWRNGGLVTQPDYFDDLDAFLRR